MLDNIRLASCVPKRNHEAATGDYGHRSDYHRGYCSRAGQQERPL